MNASRCLTEYGMTQLAEIESIGRFFSEKLAFAGVTCVEELLLAAATRDGRSQLIRVTGLTNRMLIYWVNKADLARVRGIGTEYLELLEVAQIETLVDLSFCNAELLREKFVELNNRKRLVRVVPTIASIHYWIEQAKTLPRVVEYKMCSE